MAFFQSLPKIHDRGWGSEQKSIWKLTALRFLKVKTFVLRPQSDKAHAELRFLYQSVYQPPWSAFRHSWIPPQESTWTPPPATVYCCLQRTLTWVLELFFSLRRFRHIMSEIAQKRLSFFVFRHFFLNLEFFPFLYSLPLAYLFRHYDRFDLLFIGYF